MTYDSEIGSRDDFIENLQRMTKGARAVRIENADWRMTLLTDLGGEIVDLYQKKAKRQWMEAWDRPSINLPRGTWGWRLGEDSPKSYTCEGRGDTATVVAHYEDGSTGQLRIDLTAQGLDFEALIRHAGTTPRLYRLTAGGDLIHNANLSGDPGQLNPPKVDSEPGLAGIHAEIASPGFPLRQGGQWRARYRLTIR
jgi:hypothetical protein